MKYDENVANAVSVLRDAHINASQGLSKELFWLTSSLVPMVNVDLLITNGDGQLLLARRDDEFHPKSWHIPGGCIRFGETMLERVHKTAIAELGCDVIVEKGPIAIRDAIRDPIRERYYPNERRHFISILFRCRLAGYIQNKELTEDDAGYLKWFAKVPEDLVPIQHIYDDILKQWK